MNERPDVLVVEDDTDLRAMLQVWLQDHGIVTATATDGVDGLSRTRALHPRVIVTDHMMPRMRGDVMLDVLENERQSPVRAIIITAARTNLRGFRCPVIVKTFDLIEITSIIRQTLAQDMEEPA